MWKLIKLVRKREKGAKEIDAIIGWKKYMKAKFPHTRIDSPWNRDKGTKSKWACWIQSIIPLKRIHISFFFKVRTNFFFFASLSFHSFVCAFFLFHSHQRHTYIPFCCKDFRAQPLFKMKKKNRVTYFRFIDSSADNIVYTFYVLAL